MKNKEKNYSEPHHGKNCLKQNTKAARGEKKTQYFQKNTYISTAGYTTENMEA